MRRLGYIGDPRVLAPPSDIMKMTDQIAKGDPAAE
jgi:hypothetical protein